MGESNRGFQEALRYPFFSALFQRRSRRISKGIRSVPAGKLSYVSNQAPQPLSPLEEALLVAPTGITGMTMPDDPTERGDHQHLLGSPMLELAGRAGSSPDNAQATYFFLMNDSGTYFLRCPEGLKPPPFVDGQLEPNSLIDYVARCKARVLDKRLEFPRVSPFYIGRKAFVSNLADTTILVPILDLTRQYINGLMFLLSQGDGHRPTIIDKGSASGPGRVSAADFVRAADGQNVRIGWQGSGVTPWRARLPRADRRRAGDAGILDRRGPWSSAGLPARRARRRRVAPGGNAARRAPRANRDSGRERFPEERRPGARGRLAGRAGTLRRPRG